MSKPFSTHGKYRAFIVKATIFTLITAGCLAILEIGAGLIWKKKYNELLETELHGYDRVDYQRSIIVPMHNTQLTVAGYRELLTKNKKTIGLKNFERDMQNQGLAEDAVLLQINEFGFKGPAIAVPKPTNVFRILTIGDSVTWGNDQDYFTYPRAMERELREYAAQANCAAKVEVVNGGVQGYNYERVLNRVDEYLAIQPDLITIYLGWNRTIGRADPAKNLFLYRNSAVYRIYYHFLINRSQQGLTADFNTKTYYDKNDPAMAAYQDYRDFAYDVKDLNILVELIREHHPTTQVVLMTIAGLLDLRLEPDQHALHMAYPIASTNNLYAYPLLTKVYNEELRAYAKRKPLPLIDFENYALEHFQPRNEHFMDSVHLTRTAYLKMGQYFAQQLVPYVNTCKSRATGQKPRGKIATVYQHGNP